MGLGKLLLIHFPEFLGHVFNRLILLRNELVAPSLSFKKGVEWMTFLFKIDFDFESYFSLYDNNGVSMIGFQFFSERKNWL